MVYQNGRKYGMGARSDQVHNIRLTEDNLGWVGGGEYSLLYVKHSMKPFVSIPANFFTQELFLHSFNLHSISSSHTMRDRIIFEDLDTTLHVSTLCLLDTMHMTRSPRPPTLPSVLPYCKCVNWRSTQEDNTVRFTYHL